MSYFRHDTSCSSSFPRYVAMALALCALQLAVWEPLSARDAGPVAHAAAANAPGSRPDAPAGKLSLVASVAGEAMAGSLALPAFGLSLLAPAPTTKRFGVTTDEPINLREGPGTTYPIVAQLPDDARLEVLDEQDGWYRVITPWDTGGWVVDDFIEIVPASAANTRPEPLGSASVAEDSLHLRMGPGTGYASYGKLARGILLDVLQLQDDWYKVRSPNGNIGWVAAEFTALDWLPDSYGGAAEISAGTASSDAVRVAQKYAESRYLWGGSGPGGFDCSGLVAYVYRQVGVWLPRLARQQYSTGNGRRISTIDALEPGDLVFFERTTSDTGITHAAIYFGDGIMLGARSERLGVRYSSVYEPFWSSHFVGGLRPYR